MNLMDQLMRAERERDTARQLMMDCAEALEEAAVGLRTVLSRAVVRPSEVAAAMGNERAHHVALLSVAERLRQAERRVEGLHERLRLPMVVVAGEMRGGEGA